MRRSRVLPTFALLALTLAAALGVAGPAFAKTKVTHKAAHQAIDADFRVDITAAPGQPFPTTNAITLWVPKGVTNGGTMPSCDPADIDKRGSDLACPRKSIVGSGKGLGLIAFPSQTAVEKLTIMMFNGPGHTLLAEVKGFNPVSLDVVVQSVITRPAGYGMQLYFPFPDSLIHPTPGSTASLMHMEASLTGKTGWLRSTSCPPTGWSLGALLETVTGGSTKISADLACVDVKP